MATSCRRKPSKQPPLLYHLYYKQNHTVFLPMVVFLLSLFILHTGVLSQSDDPLNVEEKKALLKFIAGVRYKGFSWKESEPACSWKGVTCDTENKTVLYLRLPAKSLVGKIPNNSIGMLTSLRVLSLRINGLNGQIPSDFSNLTSLTHLSLYNNSFSGQLPYINANLTSFNVSLNKLNSRIPSSFSKFPISAFSVNVFLCSDPFPPCNSSYPPPPVVEPEKKPKKKEKIVVISIGSAVLLLILLCCVRKKMYQQSKQPPKPPLASSPAASRTGKSAEGERNKLVLFEDGIYRFDLEDLLKASAEVLGEGGAGISYKQVLEEKNTTMVVKRFKDVVLSQKEFEAKVEVLGKMKNKHVVPLIASYYSKHEKWLVYDYMPAGSLSAHLHGSTGSTRTQLDWNHRMRIALSAAKGLEYLHMDAPEQVVHGNIKSSNILLRQETNYEASVSDYGLNTFLNSLSSLNHGVTGYWAPEVPKAQEVTCESDVYSFGVLLLELLTGKTPKQQLSLDNEGTVDFSKWVGSILCEEPKAEIFDMELRGHNVEEMVQLLRIAKHCVSFQPNERPTMHDVVIRMENMWLGPSLDDHSKGYDYTPSTETRDTPSTITP